MIGERLKSERQRIGVSQPGLASIVGASKSAIISWEKGASAPTANALQEMANAGFDVLYIITGKRYRDTPSVEKDILAVELAEIRRDLIDPSRARRGNETDEETTGRLLERAKATLEGGLRHEAHVIASAELTQEWSALLDVVNDPKKLSLLRAADYAQTRQRLEDEQELLANWLTTTSYEPDYTALRSMANLAIEYGVPHKVIVDLAHDIWQDIQEQDSAKLTIRLHEERKNQLGSGNL